MENKPHFLEDKIFWLIAAAMAIVFIYIFCITFISIPEKNIRFADTAQDFLLGTVLSGCIGYYIGGNPAQKKSPSDNQNNNVQP